MAINRFYRPSQPAYTSQFVAEQYPVDLMLQQGAMKYSQAQQFYQNVGKLSALNATLQPGYRTTRMAPMIRRKYEDEIQAFTEKYSDSYDSPQALMDLSRLRNTWSNDPDVQLIMYDREMGNKQRDKMLQDTDTYHLDIDKNVDRESGMLKQFNPGDSYIGYQPLLKYVDIPTQLRGELDKVPWQKGTRSAIRMVPDPTNPTGQRMIKQEIEQDIEQRTLDTFAPTIQTLINRYRQGGEEWTEYLRAKAGADVSDEQLAKYFANIAIPLTGVKETADYNYETMRDWLGKDYEGQGNMPVFKLPGTGIEPGSKKVRPRDIRRSALINKFSKDDFNFTDNDQYLNTLHKAAIEQNNKEILNEDINEQKRFLIKYLKDDNSSINQTYKYNYKGYDDPDVREDKTKEIFGLNVVSGKLNADVTSSAILGSTLIDYETGKEIQDPDEKAKLLKEGIAVSVEGELKDDYMAPKPNMKVVNIDGKTYFMTGNQRETEEKRPIWNFKGYERAVDTGIGNTFVMEFRGGPDEQNPVAFLDHTVRDEYRNDYNNIDYQSPGTLYMKTVKDFTDGGKVKVKVYAHNPKDAQILNNENPFFIKEYALAEEGSLDNIYKRIISERDALLQGKNTVLENFQ